MANIEKEREAIIDVLSNLIKFMDSVMPAMNDYYDALGKNLEEEINEILDNNTFDEKCDEADIAVDGMNLPEEIIAKEVARKIREVVASQNPKEDFVVRIEVYADGEKIEPSGN